MLFVEMKSVKLSCYFSCKEVCVESTLYDLVLRKALKMLLTLQQTLNIVVWDPAMHFYTQDFQAVLAKWKSSSTFSSQWQSVAISVRLWHFGQTVAVSGSQWQSVAVSGSQWQSVAVIGSQ